MNRFFKIGGIAAALAVLAASQAASQSIQINPGILQLKPIVTCVVAGSPAEFPDDLEFWNKGIGTLAAGTKVQWNLPGTNKYGQYVLKAALPAGKGVKASGILGTSYEAGRPCYAKVV